MNALPRNDMSADAFLANDSHADLSDFTLTVRNPGERERDSGMMPNSFRPIPSQSAFYRPFPNFRNI
jgi:hypothetical protein